MSDLYCGAHVYGGPCLLIVDVYGHAFMENPVSTHDPIPAYMRCPECRASEGIVFYTGRTAVAPPPRPRALSQWTNGAVH